MPIKYKFFVLIYKFLTKILRSDIFVIVNNNIVIKKCF